ncbi:thioether cross-link-forming SCIFF peptide maturase [Caldanaerobius polysaccharolyticus]|uniref:thioether cross-link-forming SCIFF peptide maturase n=1 Tax=Caldanaerobius polysaccharolyticus TaxID=44256 RepID=UPI000558A986|nr:thioether cross-link-forming SCIFF peptide maturase [Caldanaerobius polysaccharolyticus]
MGIHKFEIDGSKIALDVNSSLLLALDDLSYRLLDYVDDKSVDDAIKDLNHIYGERDIIEAYEELAALKDNGTLFAPDPYEGEDLPYGEPVVKSLCLNVAHDCNLRCKYCFASTGNFKGQRKLMSSEVGKKAIDFLIAHSASRRHLEVDMFGGEPMMNFDVIKEIVEYGRDKADKEGKSINFTLTTNAILLDDKNMEYINENFYNVVLSLDGRPEVNDRMRILKDGSGSYGCIVDKILKMVQMRKEKEYYVRGTYTRYNLDFAQDVLHMVDLGIDRVSVEPVVAPEDADYALQEQDLPVIRDQYRFLAHEYIKRYREGKPFIFFHFNVDLDEGPCLQKRIKGCGAGNEYLAVTPDGDIYPCHQFVGINKYKMGNVIRKELDRDMQLKFMKTNIYTKSRCRICWARYFCSGGCHASAHQFSGSLDVPHRLSCEILKIRLECALMIKAVLSNENLYAKEADTNEL